MGRHWSNRLECHACGQVFRSAIAEARHRHNFPALCKRNKRFAKWQAEITREQVDCAG